jgi:hypothetical protein
MRTGIVALAGILALAAQASAKDPFGIFPDRKPVQAKMVDMSHLVVPVPATPSRMTLTGVLSKFNIPWLFQTKPMPGLPATRPQLGLQRLTPQSASPYQPLVPFTQGK